MHTGEITVFFSLPFTPKKRRTHFYHGHLALAIKGTVYQLFDPAFLKSPFMVSAMPEKEWLYGNSRIWSHNDPGSKTYSWVYLYGLGEALRTTVYAARIYDVPEEEINRILHAISAVGSCHNAGRVSFSPLSLNCSIFVRDLLLPLLQLRKRPHDLLPARLFKRILSQVLKSGYGIDCYSVDRQQDPRFTTHRACIGIFALNAEQHMDELVSASRYPSPDKIPKRSAFFTPVQGVDILE